MIDTNKYEGHSPAPWLATHDRLEHGWVVNHDGWRVWVGEKGTDAPHLQNNRFGSESLSEADAQLIADAPLLLAEVKRLREDNKKLHDAINGCAYTNKQGSAHDLYCESMVERCPVCDENVESGCHPYCESMEGR